MSRIFVHQALAAILIAITTTARPEDGAKALPFDLVPPLKILRTGYYSDGGTLMFEIADSRGRAIVGGFDGRMCVMQDIDRCRPWHLFLGGDHPTKAETRLLPLWGEEERALVQVLDFLIDGLLAPADQQRIAEVRSLGELPDSVSGDLWHLVGRKVRRERLLEAIDRGLLDCDDCMKSRLGVSAPFTTTCIAFRDSASSYEVIMHDAEGVEFVLWLPADSLSIDPPPTSMSYRYVRTQVYHTDAGPVEFKVHSVIRSALGAGGDRCLLTTVLVSLPAAGHELDGAELKNPLIQTARWRVRKTLEGDKRR